MLLTAVSGVDGGGTPIHTNYDLLSGAGFEADVYSLVYAGAGSELPNDSLFVPLNKGETLLVYFVSNAAETGHVDLDGPVSVR